MRTFYVFCLLFAVFLPRAVAADLEGGIFNNSSTLQIKFRASGGTFNSQITACQFAIKYPTSYGVQFGTTVNSTIITMSYQTTQALGGYTYRFYAWTGAYTPNWPENDEKTIMEVTISGGTGLGSFSLVTEDPLVNGNDPNFYIESPTGLPGGYSLGVYQYIASGVPLPVQLTGFSAARAGQDVRLRWHTTSELNNSGFEIQRSFDGLTWENRGFVDGYGTTDIDHQYSSIDRLSDRDMNHACVAYRLNQIDRDGSAHCSKPITLGLAIVPSGSSLQAPFPNPAVGSTTVAFSLFEAERVSVVVINTSGEIVARPIQDELLPPGSHQTVMDLPSLTSGAYRLVLRTSAGLHERMLYIVK
jgi:hypothetical protein